MSTGTEDLSSQSLVARLVYGAGTDVGLRREENQDSFGVIERPNSRLFIVADGMGGVKGGGIASNLAVATVRERLAEASAIGRDELVSAVEIANAAIFKRGGSEDGTQGMGTTFVGLAFVDAGMFVINVGDSRAYRIRSGGIEQLTEDHTLVRELIRTGAISPEQAENHPVSHMLTRSLGPASEVNVDCNFQTDVVDGDVFLMCSDGLYNLVYDSEMLEIVRKNSLDEAIQKLIDLANSRGGTDNITVMLVRVGDPKNEPHQIDDELTSDTVDDLRAALRAEPQAPYIEDAEGGSSTVRSTYSTGGEAGTVGALPPALIRPRFRLSNTAFVAALAGIVGLVVGTVLRSGDDEPYVGPIVGPNPLAAKIAMLDLARPDGDEMSLSQVVVSPIAPGADGDGVNVDIGDDWGGRTKSSLLSSSERDVLGKRREALNARLVTLSERIDTLSQPLSGRLADTLKASSDEISNLENELKGLRAELETATRKLAVWLGRRKRLEGSDPVDMALEVAVSSPSVRERKEEFERASWAYLKEVEVWRYSPGDESLGRRVAQLARSRNQRIKELADEVRRAIDTSVEEADHQIAELTVRRDQVQGKLEPLYKDIQFVKVLTTGSSQQKMEKRDELIHERDALQAELEELGRMLP
jgi:serine/threonine protein phosphatase PrpC